MFIMSNGYMFWGIVLSAFVASWVYFNKGDFCGNGYTSAWGRFLCNGSFGLGIKIFFFASLILTIVALVMYGKKEMTWDDTPFKAVTIGAVVCAVLFVVFTIMGYCKWCWGEMPIGRITGWTLFVCIPAGIYLLMQSPAIPDGAISSAFKSAIKLKMNENIMAIFKEAGIYQFATYKEMLYNSQYHKIAMAFFAINCSVHLLLCNKWMHLTKTFNRILYPLVVCVHTFLLIPSAIALGFFGGAFFICALLIIVYIIAGIFAICFLWVFISAWFTQNFGTGRSGVLSDGTKIRQECGDQWVDENGRRWTNTGGNEFTRN